MTPKVSIIILNWNGWRDTIECLESLFRITYLNYDVVIIDNGSTDESIKKIKEHAQGKIKVDSKFIEYSIMNKPIKIIEYTREEIFMGNRKKEFNNAQSFGKMILIKNDKNYGFAEGNNIGMRYVSEVLKSSYVLLLNNDTVVDIEFLRELVVIAESDKQIGILGPIVYNYDNPDEIQSAGTKLVLKKGKEHLFKSYEIDQNGADNVINVDSVSGCALLAKSELFNKIGYLNSEYFAYWEETDFCLRAKKNGYKIVCVPKAKIWHKGSTSANKVSGLKEYYMTRNMFWFMKQHADKKDNFSFIIYFFAYEIWFKIGLYLLKYKNISLVQHFLKGIKDGMKKI